MVSVVLVPIEIALQLSEAVDELDERLERGDFANLKPVRLSGGVFPAEVAVKIALADVAQCYERGRGGYQMRAERWESLLELVEQLAALPHGGGEHAREA